jgi:signal transduction histidine kinase
MKRPSAFLAVLLAAVGVGLAIGQLGLVLVLNASNEAANSGRAGVITIIALALVGALIGIRQPQNPIGWLMLSIAICGALIDFPKEYLAFSSVIHPLPGATVLYWLSQIVWMLLFVQLLVAVPILFPDGRLMSRRWLIPVVAGGLLALIGIIASLDPTSTKPVPNPVSVPALNGASQILNSAPYWILFLLTLLSGVASLFVRYRRADQQQRQQIKWLLVAAVLTLSVLTSQLFIPGMRFSWLLPVGVAFLPIAIGIAILRYRLYDVDLIINKALVYGALAALITGAYLLVVIGIGTVVGSSRQLPLSILATLVIAVSFQPLRQRSQQLANHLVYGKRATPYETLSQFSEHLSETFSQEGILDRMARLLQQGTGAERAEVWVRSGQRLLLAASSPARDGSPELPMSNGTLPRMERDSVVPVSYQGELLGALAVMKKRGETMQPVEEKLLNNLAGQAGLVLKNVGLNRELLARLEDLRASRQRLVTAQDEERRRIERDLHDGAQQHLVALKVNLALAEAAAEPQSKVRSMLTQLKTDAEEALNTTRELARGIYPPLLASDGLAAALRAQVRRSLVPVDFDVDGLPRLAREVEAAVYFCCLEALQNIGKYAQATQVRLRVRFEDSRLAFSVQDNGKGFDLNQIRDVHGIENMRDRLEALGGNLRVESRTGEGTRVTGDVPITDQATAVTSGLGRGEAEDAAPEGVAGPQVGNR